MPVECAYPPPHPHPLVALAAVRSVVVDSLLLPVFGSVVVLCFVVRYFVSILALQLS